MPKGIPLKNLDAIINRLSRKTKSNILLSGFLKILGLNKKIYSFPHIERINKNSLRGLE
jgi:hypothetical protein